MELAHYEKVSMQEEEGCKEKAGLNSRSASRAES